MFPLILTILNPFFLTVLDRDHNRAIGGTRIILETLRIPIKDCWYTGENPN